MLKSLISAFAMYSKIPMPEIEWSEENHKYSLCFFPLIGLIIGFVEYIWGAFCYAFQIGTVLYSAVSVIIPVIVTGGIHLDGFCDVLDAKNSYADRERKLEIMKDSRVGAFALIGLVSYFIIQFGLYSEISSEHAFMSSGIIFIISRALSGIGAVTLKCAKKSGTLQGFSEPADRKITLVSLILIYAFCILFLIYIDMLCGISVFLVSALSFVYYRNFAYKTFGEITGDLAGYFLQICEISMLGVIVLCDILERGVCC